MFLICILSKNLKMQIDIWNMFSDKFIKIKYIISYISNICLVKSTWFRRKKLKTSDVNFAPHVILSGFMNMYIFELENKTKIQTDIFVQCM